MYVVRMNSGVESIDSGCDASESDLSLAADTLSSSSYESLDGRTEDPTSCPSSTGSDLSYTSVVSFHGSQRRISSSIGIPDVSAERHDEFQYTTVTPISYRETNEDMNSNERDAIDYQPSKGSGWFRCGGYGLRRNSGSIGCRRIKRYLYTGTTGKLEIPTFVEDDAMNVSNNDNDCELQRRGGGGRRRRRWSGGCESGAMDSKINFDAVVTPCCDDAPQNFHFEQNRFPPGCLDIVLNGNDRESSDTHGSDIYREGGSGCESEDALVHCWRPSSTSGFGTADQRSSRSWDSLNSFDGSDGPDEVLRTRSDPGDCFDDDEEEVMRDDGRLVPVSVSLQSVSSSVDVDVRCADGVFHIDTSLCNSNDDVDDDDGAMVDMTITPNDCCTAGEDDKQYEVELINNYIRCSDYGRRGSDVEDRLKHSFGNTMNMTRRGGTFGWGSICGRTEERYNPYCLESPLCLCAEATCGRRTITLEDNDCWNSESERKTGKRQSKSSLSSAATVKRRRRGRSSSRDTHRRNTHSKHRKSNRKSHQAGSTDDSRRRRTRHRKSRSKSAHRNSSKKSSAHVATDARARLSTTRKSKTSNDGRKRSCHKRAADGTVKRSCHKRATEEATATPYQIKSMGGCANENRCVLTTSTNNQSPYHTTASTHPRSSAVAATPKRSSHPKCGLDASRKTTSAAIRCEGVENGERRTIGGLAKRRTKSSHYPSASRHHSRARNDSRANVSTSKSCVNTRGSSPNADSRHQRTPHGSRRSSRHSSVRRKSTRDAMGRMVSSRRASHRSSRDEPSRVSHGQAPTTTDLQRDAVSLAIAAAVIRSKSDTTPVSKAFSAPVALGNYKTNTKRSFRVETMRLKGPDNNNSNRAKTTYHKPEEASVVNSAVQAAVATVIEPHSGQSTGVHASSHYHENDLIVMPIIVPSKPTEYGPVSGTYLAGGELYGKPFRYIPYLFPTRANVSYEDDHGLYRNRTTWCVDRRFNRAKTHSNPSFDEHVRLIPSIRSSRAAIQPPMEEPCSPLSLASTRYLDAVIEQDEELVRVPPAEAAECPLRQSQSFIGYIDSVNPQPKVLTSSERLDPPPPRKQSVSFADMKPGFDDLMTSMCPPYFLEGNRRDDLYLRPSGRVSEFPDFSDDALLNPSELLSRVAAASDRDLMRPSSILPPRPKSDAVGTSVTQVVSRWRKHYMDNDPCFPQQECKDTWLRSLNSKSIQFNDDDDDCKPMKTLRDCRSVETNKIIYYQKTDSSCCNVIDPCDVDVDCACAYDCDEFTDGCSSRRLPYRRCSDSTSTVSSSSCCGGGCGGYGGYGEYGGGGSSSSRYRPLSNSSSTMNGDSRHRRFSSINRSSLDSMMHGSSSSSNIHPLSTSSMMGSNRFDEGDRRSSCCDPPSNSRLFCGDSSSSSSSSSSYGNGSGSRSQATMESDCDREKYYVESLLASIRSSARDFMTDIIAKNAVQQQQQKQQQQQQQKQQMQQEQRHEKQPNQQQQQPRRQHQQQFQQQQQQQLEQQLLEQWHQQQRQQLRPSSFQQQQQQRQQQQEGLSESILTDYNSKGRS